MLNLFDPLVPPDRLHPVFLHLCHPQFEPERAVLLDWSDGFADRDGKFVKEFQTSFESSLWELYVFACIKRLGGTTDFRHPAPDFVSQINRHDVCIEATVTQPPAGGEPAYGPGAAPIPEDLNEFNVESTLRLCSRISAKSNKFLSSYSLLPHVDTKPYVIAIASFDRPYPHFAANRPIMAALYGVYFDEEQTLSIGSSQVIQRPVDGIAKTPTADVPAAYFLDDGLEHVSAILYSPVANWGKIRALADAPEAQTIYTTLHPNPGSLKSTIRRQVKSDYTEDLLDGLYVLHNPFATHPLSIDVFDHPRVAQFVVDSSGDQRFVAPDDFLLVRMLQSFTTDGATSQ